jgi:hypothetical protein
VITTSATSQKLEEKKEKKNPGFGPIFFFPAE